MIENYVKSHIGQRDLNEDRYLVDEELGLYIVADGVGGLEKGDVASKLTCELIQNSIKQGLSLVASIEAAHRLILSELQTNKSNIGMASTVVAIRFTDTNYEIAWVGDSRVYLWDGELKLLTRDHSYLELLHVSGHIGIDDFNDHPNKNVISQAIGIERKSIEVATNTGTLDKNQLLLMATDGLYEVVKEQSMIENLVLNNPIKKLTDALVDCAVDLGGKDNITLLVLKSDINLKDKQDSIQADVVRIFNAKTGKATELQEDIKNQPTPIKKTITKSVFPQDLSKSESGKGANMSASFKPFELLLFILIIIAILVLMTLVM